ncbi:heterokaryon incompatibility protein [Colletotrichum tofieldiae]|nr:heterokaryon incompatibility protein [Colletotrichum tofieldiae]
MSWAAGRQTTRDEDLAYCLMGLFGVNVPVLYGEGLAGAFRRLQHGIISTSPDETIFAWRADPAREVVDPGTGERRRRARALHSASPFRLFSMTNMGLSIVADLIPLAGGSPRGSPAPQTMSEPSPLVVLPIGASDRPTDTSPRTRVGIYLEPVLQASPTGHRQTFYRRVRCDEFCFAPKGEFPRGEELDIYVLEDNQFAEMQFADRPGSPGPGGWSPSIGTRLSLSPSASPRPSPRASPRPGMEM